MSPVSTGPLPLSQLLSNSLTFVQGYWKPILIGALIFGTAGALVGGTVAGGALVGMKGVVNELGMDAGKLEELSVRIQNGDESAMAEMEALLENTVGSMGEEAQVMMVGRMVRMFGPLIGVGALLGLLIGVLSHAFFLLLALSPTQDAMVVLKKTPALFFPLLGLWIWVFLRSFAWIPVLGLIPAIILGPRFMLSSVILVKEKKGIMESVNSSYARTKGYWGKIVGNAIVAGLCVMLAGIVVGIVIGILGNMVPLVGLWLQPIAKYAFSAFMTVFMVQLSLTIMLNPMGILQAAPVRAAAVPATVTKKAPAKKKSAAKKSAVKKKV